MIRDSRKCIRIDDPRCVCPICGSTLKWACASEADSKGRADCQNGMMVSRRMDKDGQEYGPGDEVHPPCRWAGTTTYRFPDGKVYVHWPFNTLLLKTDLWKLLREAMSHEPKADS